MVLINELVLLLFCFLLWFAKGDESIEFKLEHINCIDEKVNVTVKCTVPHPINGINLSINGSEISLCRAFKGPPYKYCNNMLETTHQNAVAYLLDNSMFYTTEGAYNYLISKTVVCRNGGTDDANYSLSIPNSICMITTNDNTLDVVRFVMLLIVVLVAFATYICLQNGEGCPCNENISQDTSNAEFTEGCPCNANRSQDHSDAMLTEGCPCNANRSQDHSDAVLTVGCPCTETRSQDPSNAVLTGFKIAVCFISFNVSVVCCTVISEFDMTIGWKIVLCGCFWVLWIVQFVIPIYCTKKNNPS